MSLLTELLAKLNGEAVESLREVVAHASQVRATMRQDSDYAVTASPEDLHGRLVNARHAVDDLEASLASLIILRARVEQGVADRKGEIEDAEVAVATTVSPAEFSSARDRSVDLNGRTISERIRLRKAEALQRDTYSAYEYVKLLHRGADSARRDYEVRLRAITLVTQLEKGG